MNVLRFFRHSIRSWGQLIFLFIASRQHVKFCQTSLNHMSSWFNYSRWWFILRSSWSFNYGSFPQWYSYIFGPFSRPGWRSRQVFQEPPRGGRPGDADVSLGISRLILLIFWFWWISWRPSQIVCHLRFVLLQSHAGGWH